MSVASRQLQSLIRREVLRFVRRPYNTFLPPLITNVLYFSVFGVILGSRIGTISDVTYIQFVLPGLVVLGAISNAFENASFSIFHGRWNEYIHEVITSPLSHSYTVAGYVLASALRGFIIGGLIIGVGFLFTSIPFAHPLYLVSFGVITTTLFAGLGVIGGLIAEDFDHLTVMNQFLLRPLVFFGGVFYSLDQLDGLAYTASLLNPMVYMVNGVRYGMLGMSEINPNTSLVVLTAATIVVLFVNLVLFKRGFGITD
ncbi:ABC transporter permease [Natrinema hispanicum]|uniref:ABC-2 type transport system permease protein n=1 Tax=Natrinema hispanicum TaxID=392421 RepID=A0A1I0GPZ9_9EURY|nr:ABC transporter permease [Natrinema hispanicum]SDC99213.1 ABC-2 type transport system permease protein [Natrinema hispanicum]SET72343.1 ABC-2 type transport system permease protein [Natrinema hispanicum]